MPTCHFFMDEGKLCCLWSHEFKLVWRCHQLLSGFLIKGHLPQMSRQPCRSLIIRVIMKWSRGLCTDILAFALQLRKTSARRPFDEGVVWPVIASNRVPYFWMRSVRSHSSSGRKGREVERGSGVYAYVVFHKLICVRKTCRDIIGFFIIFFMIFIKMSLFY